MADQEERKTTVKSTTAKTVLVFQPLIQHFLIF